MESPLAKEVEPSGNVCVIKDGELPESFDIKSASLKSIPLAKNRLEFAPAEDGDNLPSAE